MAEANERFGVFPQVSGFMKRSIRVLSIAVSIVVLGAVAGYITALSRLPKTSGRVKLPFLTNEVRVIRDQWGIPHISARNQKDLYRAFGFVAAQDRLFQMDVHRRLANGELSEVFGDSLLKYDKLLRSLRIRKSQEELLKRHRPDMNPEMLEEAEAYLQGLNYYIDTQPLPLEFALLRYKPRHFEFVEILAFPGYMAYGFAEAFKEDILFGGLMKELPARKLAELRAGYGPSDPTIVGDLRGVFGISLDKVALADFANSVEELFKGIGAFHGSNSWVLAPSRTVSGKALLANDPHIGFSKPSIWYEAHLQAPGFEIYGHFLSYLPFAVLGHNREMGWALTMSEIDDADFYAETINPENPSQVRYKGKWVPVETAEEEILVRGQSPVKMQVRVTPHGPLVGELLQGAQNSAISLKWQFHDPNNRAFETFYGLARARSVEDFKRALSKAAAPGLNVSYADKDGNIAWYTMGNIPLRPQGMHSDTILDGASGKDEYLGLVPFEKHPHLVNPRSGVIITANNKPSDKLPYEISGYWQPSERAQRIAELLNQKQKWSVEDTKVIQNDDYDVLSREVLLDLLGAIGEPSGPLEKKALMALKFWDGFDRRDSVGASIFQELNFQVLRAAVIDELGEERWEAFAPLAESWHFYKRLVKNPDSSWWDNVKTLDTVESRESVIRGSFSTAVRRLREKFGGDVSQWKWGRLHTLEFVHPLGRKKPLDKIFNTGPFAVGGNYAVVDAMGASRANDDFHVNHGPSTRRIIDFAEPERAWGINPLGESGHLMSQHEHDQTELFLDGRYRREYLDEKDILAEPHEELSLVP